MTTNDISIIDHACADAGRAHRGTMIFATVERIVEAINRRPGLHAQVQRAIVKPGEDTVVQFVVRDHATAVAYALLATRLSPNVTVAARIGDIGERPCDSEHDGTPGS